MPDKEDIFNQSVMALHNLYKYAWSYGDNSILEMCEEIIQKYGQHKLTVLITYLVVENELPLYEDESPSPATVWKKTLELTDVDPKTDLNPDWCYNEIVKANPEDGLHTIAIWAVDKEFVLLNN